MPGQYIPSCTEEGEYEKEQCHGSTGHCWCVDETGKEIEGTRTTPTQDRVNCEKGT